MNNYDLRLGDCLEIMQTLDDCTVDTIITDPPYGLEFMGKGWDGQVPGVEFWREMLRVAKPGALLLSFGGTRTWHRLAVAIEDAGWELRDTIAWLYGSGFPKSLNISKAIDKAAGAERTETEWVDRYHDGKTRKELGYSNHNGSVKYTPGQNGNTITLPATELARTFDGYGTALKPAFEPVIVAMKPLDGTFAQNAERRGVSGLNIDECRIEIEGDPYKDGFRRKEYTESKNCSIFGMGNRGIYTKSPHKQGRWPANVILDERAAEMLDEMSGERKSGYRVNPSTNKSTWYGDRTGKHIEGERGYPDTGGASRFFYCAKASRSERNAGLDGMEAKRGDYRPNDTDDSSSMVSRLHGSASKVNHHPTVKPIKLLEYLCRLTKTPTGGIVLDPFMGSGSTGVAALNEGRYFIGIEKEPEYYEIAKRRIEYAARQLRLEL